MEIENKNEKIKEMFKQLTAKQINEVIIQISDYYGFKPASIKSNWFSRLGGISIPLLKQEKTLDILNAYFEKMNKN